MKNTLCSAVVGALLVACGTPSDSTTSPFVPGGTDAGSQDASTTDASVTLPPTPDASSPSDGGAPDGEARGECGQINDQTQVMAGPVDIVLGLDTSGSMFTQICNVSANLTRFADGVGESTHVVAVYDMGDLGLFTEFACNDQDPLASTALASDTARYLHDATAIGSTDALTKLVAQFPQYSQFLRPDAPTHFVIVSDDESEMPAAEFSSAMTAALGRPFYVHAIVADGQNCFGANDGLQYLALAMQTGGLYLPICASDWTVLFDQLKAAVVASAPLPCDFAIPAPPAGAILDTNAVQVAYTPVGGAKAEIPRAESPAQCGTNIAWHYDNASAPTRIQLCPATCDAARRGGKIGIAFGCAPAVLR